MHYFTVSTMIACQIRTIAHLQFQAAADDVIDDVINPDYMQLTTMQGCHSKSQLRRTEQREFEFSACMRLSKTP